MSRIVQVTMYLVFALAFSDTCVAMEIKPISRRALFAVTEYLLQIYRTGDATRLHRLLAPELHVRYTPEALSSILTECRMLVGEIIRISPPVMGTRYFGYSAVHAEQSTFDMILEIDNEERILFWMISSDVIAQNQPCKIYNFR